MKSPALKIIVASLAIAAGSAVAQGYGAGYGSGYGRGFGPGMGYGYGPGMMEYSSLSAEQREKVASVRAEHRARNWYAMDALRAEQSKLHGLYAAKADAEAIAEQQKKVDALREQMFRQRTEMRREMDAVLAQ